MIIISISSLKYMKTWIIFPCRGWAAKEDLFPLQGEFFLAIFSLALERRFSGARVGTEWKPCRIAPQLLAPLWLCHGTLSVPCARSSKLAWSETFCPQLYLVMLCQCGGDSGTRLCSWVWGAAQPAFRGAPLVYLGGSLGPVYCFSAIRWKSALGAGSKSDHLLLQEQGK